MAKKNINKRCPFVMECGRGKCMFEQKELGCDYYYNNAVDDNVIPDQEERRRLENERVEREKEEHQRIGAFELWCWRRLLRVPWTARRSNLSILKINPGISLEGMMLKLKL